MKVLFLTNSLDRSDGWGNVGFNLIEALRETADVEFEIYNSKDERFVLNHNSLKSRYIEDSFWSTTIFDLANVLITRRNKFDLIHVMVEHYAVLGMFLSKLLRVPYIITAHGTYIVKLPHKHKLFKRALEGSHAVIAVSNYTKKRMVEEGINANVKVINWGVDKKKFHADKSVQKKNTITFVGDLKPRKGLPFLLSALKEASTKHPEIELSVIGNVDQSAKEYREIEKLISTHALNVSFAGKTPEEELIKNYQRAKLNVLPSQSERFHFEGFGLVHLEANACGTLTVGTYESGNEDAIQPGNGFLVKYGDVESLSKTILDVFGRDAYQYPNVDILRDWVDVGKEYYQVYNSI